MLLLDFDIQSEKHQSKKTGEMNRRHQADNWKPFQMKIDRVFSRTNLLNISIAISSILFWFMSSYPANLTSDSTDILNQIRTGKFNDHHTSSYILFVRITSIDGHVIGLSTLIQSIFVYLSIFVIIRFITGKNSESKVLYIASSLVFATPVIGPIAMTIWKDAISSALVLVGIFLILDNKNKRNFGAIGLLAIGSSFRHEGIFFLIIFGSILLIICFITILMRDSTLRYRILQLLKLVGAAAALSLVFTISSEQILHSESAENWTKVAPFLEDLAVLNSQNPNPLDADSRLYVSSIFSGDANRAGSDCRNIANIFFVNGFNREIVNRDPMKAVRVWVKNFKGGAQEQLFWARYCRVQPFMPFPFSFTANSTNWFTISAEPSNNISIEQKSLVPGLGTIVRLWSSIWQANASLLGWPGLYLFVIVVTIIWNRKLSIINQYCTFALLSFFIARFIIIILTIPGSDFRYGYMFHIAGCALVATWFLEKQAISEVSK